jgi:hypothetical protein
MKQAIPIDKLMSNGLKAILGIVSVKEPVQINSNCNIVEVAMGNIRISTTAAAETRTQLATFSCCQWICY